MYFLEIVTKLESHIDFGLQDPVEQLDNTSNSLHKCGYESDAEYGMRDVRRVQVLEERRGDSGVAIAVCASSSLASMH